MVGDQGLCDLQEVIEPQNERGKAFNYTLHSPLWLYSVENHGTNMLTPGVDGRDWCHTRSCLLLSGTTIGLQLLQFLSGLL